MSEEKTAKVQKEIPIRENLYIQSSGPNDPPKLLLSRCRECGGTFYPKEEMCPKCIKEGPVVIAQLHDWQGIDLKINMFVQFVVGKIKQDLEGNVVIGPKFKPLLK